MSCALSLISSFPWTTQPSLSRDSWRGAGNWQLVLDQTARVLGLGVSVTIIAVMMPGPTMTEAPRDWGACDTARSKFPE